MKRVKSRHLLSLLALLGVVLFTGFFAARTIERAVYWRHHRDERIRPWMTVDYVARSHRVLPRVLYQALGVPGPDRRSIRRIAREQQRPIDEVINVLEKAIADARADNSQAPPLSGRERSP